MNTRRNEGGRQKPRVEVISGVRPDYTRKYEQRVRNTDGRLERGNRLSNPGDKSEAAVRETARKGIMRNVEKWSGDEGKCKTENIIKSVSWVIQKRTSGNCG